MAVVNADSDQARLEGDKLSGVPRELAQLTRAIGSPISSIENQEHALAVHRSQMKRSAVFVLEDEIRSGLAGRGCRLWPGKHLLPRTGARKQEQHQHPS